MQYYIRGAENVSGPNISPEHNLFCRNFPENIPVFSLRFKRLLEYDVDELSLRCGQDELNSVQSGSSRLISSSFLHLFEDFFIHLGKNFPTAASISPEPRSRVRTYSAPLLDASEIVFCLKP